GAGRRQDVRNPLPVLELADHRAQALDEGTFDDQVLGGAPAIGGTGTREAYQPTVVRKGGGNHARHRGTAIRTQRDRAHDGVGAEAAQGRADRLRLGVDRGVVVEQDVVSLDPSDATLLRG